MTFDLSNRETAILISVAAFMMIMMRFQQVRHSVLSLCWQVLNWKLVSISILAWSWIAFGVVILLIIGFWDTSLLKETLLWMLLSGTAIAFHGLANNNQNSRFRSIISDQLKFSAFIVFYANLRSLPLIGELLLIPSMALIGCSMAIVESDEKFQILKAPLNILTSIIGFCLLFFVTVDVVSNPTAYFTVGTLKSLILPVFLIVWTIPFGYIISLIGACEILLIRQIRGNDQSRDVRFYSFLKAFELGRFDTRRVRRMNTLMAARGRWSKSHEELDEFYEALRETMLDPDNMDYRDFIWPKHETIPGEFRYNSLDEYLEVTTPLFEQAVELWNMTVEIFHRTSGGGEPPPDIEAPAELEAFLSNKWPTAESIDLAMNDLKQPPEHVMRFDRELHSFCSELQQIFWYYSPQNTSITEPPRRGYLVFSSYRVASKQFDRLLLASSKLAALKCKEAVSASLESQDRNIFPPPSAQNPPLTTHPQAVQMTA
jgi:hypothetical protein